MKCPLSIRIIWTIHDVSQSVIHAYASSFRFWCDMLWPNSTTYIKDTLWVSNPTYRFTKLPPPFSICPVNMSSTMTKSMAPIRAILKVSRPATVAPARLMYTTGAQRASTENASTHVEHEHHQVAPLTSTTIYIPDNATVVSSQEAFSPVVNIVFDE